MIGAAIGAVGLALAVVAIFYVAEWLAGGKDNG